MKNSRTDKPFELEDAFDAMGTDVSWKIFSAEEIDQKKQSEAKRRIRKIFQENEKIFSRFDDDSELSQLNKSKGKKFKVSEAMLRVLLFCEKFHQISGGFFDPRVLENLKKIGYEKDFRKNHQFFKSKKTSLTKMKKDLVDDLIIFSEEKSALIKMDIDTTGIVKGYTIDRAAEFLLEEGFENFIIDAGGDMFIQGLNSDGEKWKIGIEDVADEKILLGLSGVGLATSGINRKQWTVNGKSFHHLINPKNPNEFSFDLKTVTVIREKTVEADGRAKSLFLMGRIEGLKFANKNEIKALFLDYKGNVYFSEKIKEDII